MSDIDVGKILVGPHGRDAIHIAIAPMTASSVLQPGEHVGLTGGGNDNNPIGIVDPFLESPVKVGEQFYIFLYPRTITSLRHVWTHPAFDADDPKVKAKDWLDAFAKIVHMSLNDLMTAAKDFNESGDYACLGFDTPNECHDEEYMNTFWKHYKTLTGLKRKSSEPYFFRCAC